MWVNVRRGYRGGARGAARPGDFGYGVHGLRYPRLYSKVELLKLKIDFKGGLFNAYHFY